MSNLVGIILYDCTKYERNKGIAFSRPLLNVYCAQVLF